LLAPDPRVFEIEMDAGKLSC